MSEEYGESDDEPKQTKKTANIQIPKEEFNRKLNTRESNKRVNLKDIDSDDMEEEYH
jgi:hypothetical protein